MHFKYFDYPNIKMIIQSAKMKHVVNLLKKEYNEHVKYVYTTNII